MLILAPIPKREWYQTPRGVKNKYRITARLNDGYIKWRGWFDDRDDADAFLFAIVSGSLQYERELWRFPTPWWHPDLGEGLSYDLATITYLTASPGTNQTFNIPTDWNSTSNNVQAVGGGASGASGDNSVGSTADSGGGGGAYAQSVNLSLTPGGTATYQIGKGGVLQAATSNGQAGGDTWFNATTFPISGQAVGAAGASPGQDDSTASPISGASGGLATFCYTTGGPKFNGGSSGTCAGAIEGSGGGGAGGPNGAGNAGVAANGNPTAGGSGDNGSGGAGGAGHNFLNGGVGGNGTEFGSGNGCGGGGGASFTNASGTNAGAGGNYGGGGGGMMSSGASNNSGAGIQGIIIVTYLSLFTVPSLEFTTARWKSKVTGY